MHGIPRIALKYSFFRTLKIIKKKHFISLELWAGWESADPPFLPHKKTILCQNTRNTANRVNVQLFSDIKNQQKIAFYIPRITSRVESADPPVLPHKKTTVCQNTRNTANRVKVQIFSDIENHQKIAFYIPRIMSVVGIRGPPSLPAP